jgi:hypothetical protein
MGGDHLVKALCGDELQEAGAVAVYHSIVELRNSLDEWLTS